MTMGWMPPKDQLHKIHFGGKPTCPMGKNPTAVSHKPSISAPMGKETPLPCLWMGIT